MIKDLTKKKTATTGLAAIDQEQLRRALDRLIRLERPRLRCLWAYFKNPMRVCGAADPGPAGSERPYRQAQEWGLPARITGVCSGGEPFADCARGALSRKEVVIENDIGWRIDTMVDYLFGKPLVVSSAAPEPARRERIGKLLRMILANSGGIGFLQQLALFGSVYGYVDVLVKAVPCDTNTMRASSCGTTDLGQAPVTEGKPGGDHQSSPDGHRTSETRTGAGPAPQTEPPATAEGGAAPGTDDRTTTDTGAAHSGEGDALLQRAARMIRLEIVEPARALPLLSCEDYRVVEAYGQVWERERESAVASGQSAVKSGWWERLRGILSGDLSAPLRVAAKRGEVQVVELISADQWMRFEDGKITAAGRNSLGELPLVHIQNSVAAFEYAGASDVEPLIPLQDELNTRLSDRAHRITLQSFKMYLGKGIEAFTDQPVSPGRMWMTDNEQAQIQEFGGDASCPSEETHISDLREALDKCSGVTPIAAGAIKNRIGRLTSAAALRVTLLALLSKTDKKRTLYGAGIERMCELALKWLDAAGVFKTSPEERRVELSWPSPLPENEMEKLTEAEAKLRLGVDQAVVLRELGY
jgi:hypothetical protein